jgi:pimeloyl-ACP methyl ester carboxylesterase
MGSVKSYARLAAVALAFCLGLAFMREAVALYDVKPGEIAGPPGSIVRIFPLEGGGPAGSQAFRILYRSRGLDNQPIVVSGAVFVPSGPAPAGGRNVIAWAHPTSGVAEPCAPSLMPDVANMIWNMPVLLGKNYIVTATDYPGLGTPGTHPYLIGESEARAVLDSVRAVRDLPNAGASNRFAVWGHSQGGHAALYTGEIAARYAPDLKLVGIAAAAPATYLIELFDADEASQGGKDLTAMALWSWSRLYHTPASTIVSAQAMPTYEKIATDCIESVPEFEAIADQGKPLQHEEFLTANPTKVEPWKSVMEKNSPGQAAAGAPVFLAQGTADTTVRPAITRQFGDHLCAQGAHVDFVEMPGVTHTFAARDSSLAAIRWMEDRFAGVPPPSSCGR